MDIEQIKAELAKQEKALANPKLFAMMGDKIKAKVDALKTQLAEAESKAETKVEETEKKVDEAQAKVDEAKADGSKADVKEAEKDLKEAKAEVKEAVEEKKEVAKVVDKAEKVEAKVEKAEAKEEKKPHGGAGRNQGRKRVIPKMIKPKAPHGGAGRNQGRKTVASKPTKIVKPANVKVTPMVAKKKAKKVVKPAVAPKVVKKVTVREKIKQSRVAKVAPAKVEKMKSVRAFGQNVEYKNDADFCKQLISAFKKRRVASKKDGKRRKTKPVFGVIVSGVKSGVSKALHSVSTKQIEKNPKEFLAKATRLEKSAIQFLNDFKAILGSDFKKSEITSEFGELEKSIKAFVAKVTKK